MSGIYRLAREMTTCKVARLEDKIQLMIIFTYTTLSTEDIKPKRMVSVGWLGRENGAWAEFWNNEYALAERK